MTDTQQKESNVQAARHGTRWLKNTLFGMLLAVVLLPLTLAVALYIPPVQQWAVDTAGRYASDATGMEIKVAEVRLAFPLDLCVKGVSCIKPNDSLPQRRDTIAMVQKAVVDVELLPLIDSEVRVNAVEMIGASMNTADLVHEARVKGRVGRLAIEGMGNAAVADISLKESLAELGRIVVDDAHLSVELSDTMPEDTTKSESQWRINIGSIAISRSDVVLHMPGDTMQVGLTLADVAATECQLDLGKKLYSLASIAMKGCAASYDNNLLPHTVGNAIDPNHIYLDGIRLRADSIYYLAPDLRLRIAECTMKERNGLALQSLVATVAMDSTKLDVDGSLNTPYSSIYARIAMETNAFSENNPGKVKAFLDASLGRQDILALGADALPEALRKAWPRHSLGLKADVEGNMQKVRIAQLSAELPTAFALDVHGEAEGFMALADNLYSNDFAATMHASLRNYGFMDIPALHAVADLNARGAEYAVAVRATEGRGSIKAKAQANIAAMRYDAEAEVDRMNIGHFVKGMHLGDLTGHIVASGRGMDVLSSKTSMRAKAEVRHFKYGNYDLDDITADALLHNGKADVDIVSHNDLLDGNVTFCALLDTKRLDATLATELNNVDLYKLQLVGMPLRLSICTHVDLSSDFADRYKVQGLVSDITIIDTAQIYRPDDIVLDVLTDRDTTIARIDCGDFLLRLNAKGGYKTLAGASDRLAAVIDKQYRERTIDQAELREALPTLSMRMHCSHDNPIYRFVKYYKFDYDYMSIDLATSKESGINGNMLVYGLNTQGYQLDTITVTLGSHSNPYEIKYLAHIKNTPPNEYVFDAFLEGKVLEHGLALGTVFYDDKHEMGMKIGTEATMVEEGISFHLSPATPIVAYKPFRLNEGNYILLGKNGKIEADVAMSADDGMGIQFYSAKGENDELPPRKQDLTLSVNKINVERLLSAIPYAPNISGMLGGDIHFVQEEDETFTLSTDLAMRNMVYEGCRIGNVGTELVYMPKTDGTHYVDGHLLLDGKEVGSVSGSYDFEGQKIDADLGFYKFPMAIANGFVPNQIIGLDGTAEGDLTIHGTLSKPDVNGELFLEAASLVSVPYGVRMRFDDDPVAIKDSRLLFENFQMYSNNEQPLIMQGYVDFADLDHVNLNMRMKADKFLLVDAKETRRSEAYGQAYINFLAAMEGELDKLRVRGRIEVLPSTNLYYILRDSPLTTDNRLKELVTFTDLNDGEQLVIHRPTVDGLDVNLTIAVDNGSHIKCWLNDAHTNYLDIIGEGDMRMRYTAGSTSLTGRYTIGEGEMKYSLPVIPLKTFNISRGSYIEFNGDMMNPRLNITAKETTKASVSIEGANQLVTFNTGVKITKTLNDMGLEFIIEAPESQTVSDELSMMSAEERGKLAVTMLTTGMYLSDGNTSAFSMNSALNSFLQSEINNIAGSALRTLDLSFGMDNSTEEDGTLHTNYSFKFAKRFWNNRIAISVGGKISTGPDVSGQNKSFFDNVEVQYRMSDISNQYLQLFYRNSVYDYLEGYVGQYGAGYMWRKKAQTLKEIIGIGTPATPAVRNTSTPKE